MSQDKIQDLEAVNKADPGQEKTHDVYLIVCTEKEELSVSLRYTARMAAYNNANMALLATMDTQEFQHWQNVENMMRRELRDKTEKKVWTIGKKINELNGLFPIIYIKEGEKENAVLDVLKEDPNIKMIVFAGNTGSGGPGTLVNYFTSKGLSKIKVPVVVVPGNLQSNEIDELFGIKSIE